MPGRYVKVFDASEAARFMDAQITAIIFARWSAYRIFDNVFNRQRERREGGMEAEDRQAYSPYHNRERASRKLDWRRTPGSLWG